MTITQKVEEALRRSLPHLPADARILVESMLSPASLAIIAATLVVWGGSHLLGAGEVADVILLAVVTLAVGFSVGVSTVQAILLHGQGRTVLARGRPQLRGRIVIAEPPTPGSQLRVSRPQSIAGGALGDTDAYGVIRVARNQSLTE